MRYLHYRVGLRSGDSVEVTINARANVLMMNDSNYAAYKRGGSFKYSGGWAERSPVVIPAPSAGYWNVVIDPRGGAVKASVRVI